MNRDFNIVSSSYKGLDITLGQGHSAPGGILIRTLVHEGSIICGPSICVDKILELANCTSIQDLVSGPMKNDISVFGGNSNIFYLKPIPQQNRKVYFSGRVGLYMTKKDVSVQSQAEYVFSDYRAFTNPETISKGRHLMLVTLIHACKDDSDISAITGAKHAVIQRYRNLYTRGKESKNSPDNYTSRISDSVAAECYGAIMKPLKPKEKETLNITLGNPSDTMYEYVQQVIQKAIHESMEIDEQSYQINIQLSPFYPSFFERVFGIHYHNYPETRELKPMYFNAWYSECCCDSKIIPVSELSVFSNTEVNVRLSNVEFNYHANVNILQLLFTRTKLSGTRHH